VVWLLAACLEPFEHDAHDLVDLRIVGMAYVDEVATAFSWEGDDAWSAVVPSQAWTGETTCEPGTACSATVTIGDGVTTETGTLVQDAQGEVPAIGELSREDSSEGWTLSLSAPATHVTHWMAPRGDIEETGPHEALYMPPGDGIWPVVALTIDGKGGNAWTIVDVPEGDIGPALWTERRVIPVDEIPGGLDGDRWYGVIEPVDDLLGYRLVGLSERDTQVGAIFCGSEDGEWNPDTLVTRECGRDEITEQAYGVAVTARAAP